MRALGERGKARIRASGNHVKRCARSQRQTASIPREQEHSSSSEDRCGAVCWRRAGSDMAAQLDHADSDGLLCAFQENTRFQKSRRSCTSSAGQESTGHRVTAAPDGLSQTWSDKLRAGRPSLCGSEAASREEVSRIRRGHCAGQQQWRSEIDSGVFSNTE